MGRDESFHGPAWDKPVRGGMRRNPLENSREYLPLQLFEPGLGRLDQSNGAGFFRQHAIVVMRQARTLGFVHESLEIGEPEQLISGDIQPASQRADRFDNGNIPGRGRPIRLHPLSGSASQCATVNEGKFFDQRAPKSAVIKKKLNYIALPGTRLTARPLRHSAGPEGEAIANSCPASCCCGPRFRRRSFRPPETTGREQSRPTDWSYVTTAESPTSLTLRERFCVERSVASRDEI